MSSVVFQSGFQTASFSVPYVSPISGGLQAGKAIFIQGAIDPQCDSFTVSLKCGQSDGDDIAFQIKPEFTINSMVLNSRQKGSWGKEEKLVLPLKKGSSFDLIIAVNSENYQVFLSGGEVGKFSHRIPLERVTVLDIRGQISLANVVFIGSWAGSQMFEQSAMMFQPQQGIMTFGGGPVEMNQTWSFEGGMCPTPQITNVIETQIQYQPTVQSEFNFSILNPVQNPTIPYTAPICGGLKAGMALYLQGTVASNADKFAVNLKTGQSDKDDIAFHFSPQIKGKAVMNCFRNGSWEKEEYASDNPFKTGEAFQMFIVAKPEGYVLYINGREYCVFKHRIPLDRVSVLNITGNVNADIVGFIENWSTVSFPQQVTSQTIELGPGTMQSGLLLPLQNPTLPYVGLIPGGLRTGMAFFLQGVGNTKGDSFAVNFKTGQSDKDDIVFHLNPRYNSKTAMNSFRNGGWEAEEFGPDNPIKMGEAFQMIILIIPDGYQVFVNGRQHYLFKHRIPLEKVSVLNIAGDVAVNLGGFIQNLQSAMMFLPQQGIDMNQIWSFEGGTTQTTQIQYQPSVQSEFKFAILNPVQNPKLPYTGPVSGGMKAGMALYLQGTVASNADRFAVNLKTGQSDKDDIAFHFSPQIKGKAVMNCFRNGSWEKEEYASDNPFKTGEAFQMFIVAKPEGYVLYINGREYCVFKHRIPLDRVSVLNITGDVNVDIVGLIENWTTIPPQFTTSTSQTVELVPATKHPELLLPLQKPALPYVGPIPGGLRTGMAFYLKGVAGTKDGGFAINFKTGQSDKDDIVFHLNPRYNSKTAMNSCRNGGWETEEFGPDSPIKMGEAFEIITIIKPAGYQVYMNGKEHYLFKHRIPLEKISALNIVGDVVVNLGGFIQTWSTSSFATNIQTTTSLGFSRWSSSTIQSELLIPVQNPALPYVSSVTGGLKAGLALYLKGTGATKGNGFAVNFKTGQSDKDDIALHFNPRYNSDVVMNSNRNGGWETEEFGPDNPFKMGQDFELFIVIKTEGYHVFVNGKEHYLFKHRIPLDKVSVLNIVGDLVVNLAGFIQNWNTVSFLRWGLSTIQSEFSLPVHNPSIPYVGPIREGLKAGLALYFQGVAGTTGDRFEINFKTGQSEKDDVAFCFNPRYNSNVVMNSYRNGGWEAEEFGPDNPFKMGQAFEIFIVIKPEGYQIYVNGKEHYLFKHRIPLEKVSAINISGHVVMNLFAFIQKWSTSFFAKQLRGFMQWSPSNIQSALLLPAQTPALPYVSSVTGGLKAGLALYLKGTGATKGNGFAVNFKTGQSDKDDIALHFNPRYNSDVVMNSNRNGGWEAEEFGPDNPFKMGQDFELFIVIKTEGYHVFVNGKEHYLFKHRIPLDKVSVLNIVGDLVVNLAGFIQNWNTVSFLRWGLSTIQSEFSLPVHNPSIPYVGPIREGLKAGLALYFQGVAGTTGDRFEINFKTGQSEKDDVAFCFNPRYNSNVVMNSYRNGGWEAEEFGPDNPFKMGQAFEIFIVIKPEGYQIYVNGKEHYLFKHRIPLEKVSAINISGHVVMNLFAFIQKWSTSFFAKQLRGFMQWSPSNIQSALLLPAQTPALPYVSSVTGGLKAGLALYLKGTGATKGNGFAVNFKTGQSDKDDIALHFNPRYNSDVVMNSNRNGGWEAEEFGPDNPFKMGQDFELFIVIKTEGYHVFVNGKEHYLFKHRIPLDKVSVLNIVGDLVVNLAGFIQNWNTVSFLRWGLSTIQSEFSLPVHNPSIPYVGPIREGLKAGLALYFQGVAGTTGDRFEINFKTGQSEKDDVAFCFNPRYNSNVVMNSYRNGGWEAEEFGPDNPFKMGQAFEIFIVIKPEGYQIYVNGKEHYLFKHRIPLEKVSAINISGHVVMNLFAFIQKWSTSFFAKQLRGFMQWSPSNIQSTLLLPAQTPALPYVSSVTGGLKAGLALYLKGTGATKGNGFAVNFKTGQSDKDDIALHFNPRYNSDVVMNSNRNGGWEAEEFGPDNPFKMGQDFELFIVIKTEGYHVFVNGKEHYLFKHRIPLDKVSVLNIVGDLVVNLAGFIQNWNTVSFLRWGLSTIQSEFSLPVHNPSIPYVGPIREGLKAGLALYFQGVAGTTGDRFEINFKTGQSEKDDVAFCFNPRYNSNVVMNSYRNGGWEAEELGPDNPFKMGQAFEMFIVIKPEGYQIYVNGKEHYLFKHRIPLEKVSAINISGHVVMNLFAFIQKWSTSFFAKQLSGFMQWSPSNIQSALLLPAQTPALPYVSSVTGGLKAGLALYLKGTGATKGNGFAVNFKTGQSDKDDIALHFNPRYNSDVVMNSNRNGGWETEEFGPDNPFKMGQDFELFIVIKTEGYHVFVNGKEHYLFKHRIPLDKVSVLNIVGDLVVNHVGFLQNWNTVSFLRWGLSTIQSEFSLPVHNPSIPYVGPIREGLKAGLALYFQGVAGTTGDRFEINFKTGQSEKDDVAFCFNPRYNSNVVMNSYRNGGWEAEELGPDNPFKMGQAFEMFIVIKPEGYQIYVNGKEHYLFKHRIPLEKVSAINISGHVVMNLFAFIQKWSTSFFAKQLRGFMQWSPSNIQSALLLPAQTPALPYVSSVTGGLKAGLALYLKGTGATKGNGFAVNFKTGQSDKDDIALHFNPRYNSDVVMNSNRNGGWETEEFGPDNPFKMGQDFELFIVIKTEGYHVFVNGKEHYLFKHRIPLDKVSVLNIVGDLVVNLAGFIQNWNTVSFLRWGLSTIQSEFSLPVHNPSIPYVGPIREGLKAGLALYFQGVAGTTGDRFEINFKTGQSEKDDVAFCFNPRYNSNVVMNSYRNGGWEAEELGPDNPFKMGQAFEMFIVIKPEGYQIYVNGKEHYLFKHRIPLEKVSAINISGHVVMNLFAFIQKWSTSFFAKHLRGFMQWSPSNIQSALLLPAQTPALPYVSSVTGGLKAGLALYLKGTGATKGNGFAVNFKTGQSDKDDIALHFNPRYNSDVVMNSNRNGGWETEEFGPDNPFKMGQDFELFIVIKTEGYHVFVNGKEHYLFKHRIPLDKVSVLNIVGDLVVNHVGFLQNWNTVSFLRWGLSTIQSEFSLPVHNPSIPYVGPIREGLKAGLALYFQGVAGTTGDRFEINFKTGQSEKDDVAFCFNPRYNSNVVMNSYRNGGWEAEELGPDNPFKMGQAFEMFIVIKPEGYQIYVNGKEHYLFKHRIPLEKVSAINISGHVVMNLFAFIQKWSTSFFAKQLRGFMQWSPSNIQSALLLPAQTPALPYVSSVTGGLKAGLALYLKGTGATKGNGFAVNFKTGQSDKDDIALHFNPRYNSDVVMNSNRNGGWETEEFGPDNPFKMGQDFELFIVIKTEGYHVFVNGKEHYLFKHRIPLDKVSVLNIVGDLVVNLAGFIQNWNTVSFLRWGLSTIQSEFSLPVHNPSIPYVGPIREGLKAGLALYFQGVAGTTGDRFEINFKTGQSEKDDVAFCFNPRYNSNVVMNSYRNGGWEAEELGPDNPFKMGQAFEMFIVIKPEGYQIYVNGKEHYLFKHRIPLEKVSAINISGHVVMNLFAFIQKWSTSFFAKHLRGFMQWSPSNIQSALLLPAQTPALPYVSSVTGGLKAGLALYLKGTGATKGNGFAVNFKTGQSDKDDIALHFNPRYNSDVVMNSNRNGGWEAEEFGPDNPFKMGQDFELFIVIKTEGYHVFVNGKEHYLFKHRIPLDKVSVLNIVGDLVVNHVGFLQNWNTVSFLRWGLSTIQSEFSLPVHNPSIPYVGPIREGLKAGLALYFQGVAGTTGDRFEINFKTGQSEKDDVAFCFNPRYNSNVVMNSYRNGGWEAEELGPDNPFKMGQSFEMFIVIKPEGYQIYVNGKEHYLFKHRIPLEKVSAINISGHVVMNLFAFIQKWSTSFFAKQLRGFMQWSPSNIQSALLLPAQTPALPYVSSVTGGLKAGLALYLKGTGATKGNGFAVNFKTGQSDKDDIALHFNPRYNSDVVMNSNRNGGWETEEFGPDNPFKMGQDFELFIVIKTEGYHVFVNGKEHYLFKHRIPLDKVSVLNIVGDLVVNLAGFIQNWNTVSFLRWGLSTIQSEFSLPVHNPSIPYVGPIREGLKAGLALYFQGVAGTTGDRFEINFKTGQSEKDDVAFCFNPRYNSNVVMNSYRNGGWEAEELGPDNPFKMGQSFEMFIVIKPEGYQIYVNGKEHYLFKHRIPLEKVSAINISGHVVMNLFAFIQKWSTSFFAKQLRGFMQWSPSNIQSALLLPAQTPALPYVSSVTGGLKAGLALYLKGTGATKGNGFAVNFKTGQSDKDDIALHFNPRYNSDVVMNSNRNGGWETEEFGPDNPFKMGQDFELFIVIKTEGYHVFVNGKEHYLFKHRIPLDKVSVLNIVGDLVVNLAGFIQNWNTVSFLRWGLSTIQSEFSLPVHNPSIPYVGPIREGLKAGLALYFQGVAGTTGDRFEINFKTGQSEKDDVAFCFNPRYNSNVVMNSYRNGGWEAEEFGPDNPFKMGQAFEMFIVIKPEGYQIYVNGKEHYLFKHRIPLEKVSAINICGQVVMNLFAFIQKWSTSFFAKHLRGFMQWSPSNIQSALLLPAQTPALPYVSSVTGGLKAGLALYLKGTGATKGNGFAVNFKTGQSDKDDIALHFNPRYNSDVVMNSNRNGGWETEEFGPDNPFKMGQDFELFIVIKTEGYHVFVNGKEHYLFKHRIPLDKVSVLNIVGDLVVNLVGFIQNWNTVSFLRWGLSTIQSEFSLPVQNPSIPYMGPIREGLKAGLALYFQGVAGTTGDRFEINFKTGHSEKDDVALHFNPRYNSNVVMNSYRNGGWEAEELGPDNPFKMGQAFEMFVVIKPEGYQIYVNGKEHYLFKHRIPLEKVLAINICGHVAINLFAFIQNWSTCPFAIRDRQILTLGSSQSKPPSIQSDLLLPVQNPIIPYVGPIPGGVRPGMSFFLQGVVASNAGRFAINFLTGPTENDDIAFHFNPRLQSKVVFNTRVQGKWQDEEYAPISSFKNGEAFELFIFFTTNGYKVQVKGQELYMFKHRMPLDKVIALFIEGAVSVSIFGFMMGMECSIPPTAGFHTHGRGFVGHSVVQHIHQGHPPPHAHPFGHKHCHK